jgi:hypothetical protein
MKKLYYLAIFFLLTISPLMSVNHLDFFKKIPQEISGWTKTEKDTIYTKDNLYDYIDGGAELYLSYGFIKLWARKYQKADQPEIIVDIFDMGSSINAYGVFSHSRETPSTLIGQESEYSGGLLIFWKGQYYISILAYPENDLARETVFRIGKKIDEAITKPGEIPDIISTLPPRGLVKESIRYFRHYIWLNSHFYISDKNILNIDKNTEAVLARYKDKNHESLLLLVSYPDKNKANKAYTRFISNYIPNITNGIGKTSDDRWAGSLLQNRKIWAVLKADNQKAVRAMLDFIKH